MAFQDVSTRLKELSHELDTKMPEALAVGVMAELMAIHKKRIFDDGLDTNGNSLGEYSTNEMYVSKDQFIRKSAFKPLGKPNKQGKRKTNKTMFLAKGYTELRDIQGRKTNHKNLKYSGSLEAGTNVVKNENSVMYGTTSPAESIKFEALEEKYEVFGLTISEKEFLKSEIQDQAIVIAKQKK